MRIRRRERREDEEEEAALPEDAGSGRRRRGVERAPPNRPQREAGRSRRRAVADRRADVSRRDAILEHDVERGERHLSRLCGINAIEQLQFWDNIRVDGVGT